MAVHVAAVYLPRGENHVTVVMMLRVERSFEYTIRNGRMRDKGADHLCDPLRATLLLSARPPTGSTPGRGEGGGTGDNRVSALREPLAHGGRWPRARGLLVRRRGRVGGVCRPTYTLVDGERGVRAPAHEGSKGSKEGKRWKEEEEEEGRESGRGSRWQQVARWPGTNVPDLLHLPTGVVDDVVCPGNDVPPVPFRNKPSVVTVPVYRVNGQGILAVMGQGVSIILRPSDLLSLSLLSFSFPAFYLPPPPPPHLFSPFFLPFYPISRDFLDHHYSRSSTTTPTYFFSSSFFSSIFLLPVVLSL